MKRDNLNYLVVGGFVCSMLVLMLVSLYLVSGSAGPADHYYVVYKNVTGIQLGTPIHYEGFPIGRVEEIQPERQDGRIRYRLALGVTRDWKIPEDSVARTVSAGLLSSVSIDLQEGQSGVYLDPGDEIAGLEGANLFSAVNDTAAELRELTRGSLRPLIEELRGIVAGVARSLSEDAPMLLGHVAALAATLNDDLPRLLAGIHRLSEALNETLPSTLEDLRALASDLRRSVPPLSRDLGHLTARLSHSAARVQRVLNDENLVHVDRTLQNAELASANIRRLSADVQQSGESLDTLLTDLNGLVAENKADVRDTVVDLRGALAELSQHMGSMAYHLEGTSRNLHEFSRQIRQNPGLLLGSSPPQD